MNSITCHSPRPSSLPKCNYMRQTTMVFQPKKPVKIQENRTGFSSFQTRATVVPHVYVTASSSATSGNLSVLLQTSFVLLLAYWIANFVVPGFIMEDYRRDKPQDNQDDPSQD